VQERERALYKQKGERKTRNGRRRKESGRYIYSTNNFVMNFKI